MTPRITLEDTSYNKSSWTINRKRKTKRRSRKRTHCGGVLPLLTAGLGAILTGAVVVKRNNARIRACHRKWYNDMVASIRAEDGAHGERDSAIVYTHIPHYKPPRLRGQIFLYKLKRKLHL